MQRTSMRFAALLLIGVVTCLVFVAGAEAAPRWGSNPSIALFEDRYIDLRVSWEEATACTTDGSTTVCFRTEAEMDDYLGSGAASLLAGAARLIGGVVPLTACSASLKLYADLGYTGSVVNLSTRFTTLNLSGLGFDNITTSYKVGPCSSTFYEGANLSGSAYPGNTSAFAQAVSMLSGWDNRVSSVYIS